MSAVAASLLASIWFGVLPTEATRGAAPPTCSAWAARLLAEHPRPGDDLAALGEAVAAYRSRCVAWRPPPTVRACRTPRRDDPTGCQSLLDDLRLSPPSLDFPHAALRADLALPHCEADGVCGLRAKLASEDFGLLLATTDDLSLRIAARERENHGWPTGACGAPHAFAYPCADGLACRNGRCRLVDPRRYLLTYFGLTPSPLPDPP